MAGVDLNLQFAGLGRGRGGLMGGGMGREGLTTLGAKYDFRASTFRAQIDSSGRLGCLLEKRLAPAVTVTFAGDMDHAKVSTCSFPPYPPLMNVSSNKPRSDWPFPSKRRETRSWSSRSGWPPRLPCHRRTDGVPAHQLARHPSPTEHELYPLSTGPLLARHTVL